VSTIHDDAPERDRLAKEVKRLEGLVYVPGMWACPKCKFSLVSASMNSLTGQVSANNEPGHKCPNCKTPLWRVTERDAGNQMVDRAEQAFAELQQAKAEHAQLREALQRMIGWADDWYSGKPNPYDELINARAILAALTPGDAS